MRCFVVENNSSHLLPFLIRVYNSSNVINKFLDRLAVDELAGGDRFSDVGWTVTESNCKFINLSTQRIKFFAQFKHDTFQLHVLWNPNNSIERFWKLKALAHYN